MTIHDLGLQPAGERCPICNTQALYWSDYSYPPIRVMDYNRNCMCEIPYLGAMICDNCNSVFPRLDTNRATPVY